MNKAGKLENFHIGDYVLWSRIDERLPGNKLMVRWIGPFRVVEALPYAFRIEHLLTKKRYDVHGSRLKFYDDASLQVNEEILEHISKQGIVLAVKSIKDHRWNKDTKQWELNISWQGLEPVEDSWEPLTTMLEDIPTLVKQYVDSAHADEVRQFLPMM